LDAQASVTERMLDSAVCRVGAMPAPVAKTVDAAGGGKIGCMDDLFSVPLGYVDPDQPVEEEPTVSPIPPEAFDHRGKWVALHAGRLLAVRDTPDELREEFGDRRSEVSFFHVPPTNVYAR
jgi:hypothetical protein